MHIHAHAWIRIYKHLHVLHSITERVAITQWRKCLLFSTNLHAANSNYRMYPHHSYVILLNIYSTCIRYIIIHVYVYKCMYICIRTRNALCSNVSLPFKWTPRLSSLPDRRNPWQCNKSCAIRPRTLRPLITHWYANRMNRWIFSTATSKVAYLVHMMSEFMVLAILYADNCAGTVHCFKSSEW